MYNHCELFAYTLLHSSPLFSHLHFVEHHFTHSLAIKLLTYPSYSLNFTQGTAHHHPFINRITIHSKNAILPSIHPQTRKKEKKKEQSSTLYENARSKKLIVFSNLCDKKMQLCSLTQFTHAPPTMVHLLYVCALFKFSRLLSYQIHHACIASCVC